MMYEKIKSVNVILRDAVIAAKKLENGSEQAYELSYKLLNAIVMLSEMQDIIISPDSLK